jgi:hypothetical protein
MTETRSIGEPVRRALAGARIRDIDVAAELRVDRKTVQRWLAGRLPHARHRWALADMLNTHEYDLWPHLAGVPAISPEVYATYPHRGSVPRDVWRELFAAAESEISLLVYSGLFVAEDADLMRTLGERARAGVALRIALGDPDSSHVQRRGDEEGISDAMAAKIRNAIVLYRPLQAAGAEICLHPTVLYNSVFRADGEMLINQHVYGIAAAYAPVLHLRHQGEPDDVFSTYTDSFERVWSSAKPLTA